MADSIWTSRRGEGPLVATALHHGHDVRPEVARELAVPPEARLREEDPYTGVWTSLAPSRVTVCRSRFEVDMNRPRHEAVYGREVWGLRVWRGGTPPPAVVQRSLAEYDAFYRFMTELLSDLARRHGRFLVLDLHSYNHRREGSGAPAADREGNPDVNVGTGSLDRALWGGAAEAFVDALSGRRVLGRALDVRENVRFRGGWFSRWVHQSFPRTGCALAIDVKKFFMDEWTGVPEPGALEAVRDALAIGVGAAAAAIGVLERV